MLNMDSIFHFRVAVTVKEVVYEFEYGAWTMMINARAVMQRETLMRWMVDKYQPMIFLCQRKDFFAQHSLDF